MKRLIAMFLIAWLPLQAWAGALAACCPEGDHASHAAAHHGHGHADATDAVAPPHGDGAEDELNPGHTCCPHFSAAVTTRFGLPAAPAAFEVPVPAPHPYTFFPEQPQRPPRA